MFARRVMVRGRVQGVGFRAAMVGAAEARGIVGWVRNRRDGSVEALVQGDAAAVESILDWCRRGPLGARVTDVSVTPVEASRAIDAFTIRATE